MLLLKTTTSTGTIAIILLSLSRVSSGIHAWDSGSFFWFSLGQMRSETTQGLALWLRFRVQGLGLRARAYTTLHAAGCYCRFGVLGEQIQGSLARV